MTREQSAQMKTNLLPRYNAPEPIAPPRPRLKLAKNRIMRMFTTPSDYVVHFVHFAPSDRSISRGAMLHRTALHLQAWYRWQMSGKTFNFDVRIIQTPHPADYYSTHNPGTSFSQWYWINALQELSNQCGGGFYQEFNDWVVYLDSQPAPGQSAGGTSGGFTSGVAVLGAQDVSSILNIDPDWTQCRGIGGCGHEYGHTHGLPHPVNEPPEVWAHAIMGIGYMTYPDAILTQSAIDQLNANPFFSPHLRMPLPDRLCSFDDGEGRPTPVPRPRPTPRLR